MIRAVATELSELENARLALARGARASDPELLRSLHHLARVTATTLSVDRVGIWAIEDSWQTLRCIISFDQPKDDCTSGTVLRLSEYPNYARALRERRVIAAENARSDPRTAELTATYLEPNGIHALLDCPVYEDGEVVAIVCHECLGGPREWSKRDRDFAASVADIVATLFAQIAVIRFQNELREMRDALAQARVMDSLGRMAAGVAHDLNNLLMGISLSLATVERELRPGSSGATAAGDARGLIDQGARLVKNLLTFAKQGSYAGLPIDVSHQVQEGLPRIRRLLGEDVALVAEVQNGSAPVRVDPGLLDQILLNLLVNARDAMPGGGTIELRCAKDGEFVVLTVRDTGIGMDSATRQRIFEPFFTTKRGAGTGLGLAIVFGAVRAAGGTINVESQPNSGSTFTVRLPLAAK